MTGLPPHNHLPCGHPAAALDVEHARCAWCAEVAAWQRVGEVADRRDVALRCEADREHAEELAAAQARERATALRLRRVRGIADDLRTAIEHRTLFASHLDGCVKQLHEETDAALTQPADTAALDGALHKARAEALREAARVMDMRAMATDGARRATYTEAAGRLRSLADDAEADPARVTSAVDADKERRAGLDERIHYPDKDR